MGRVGRRSRSQRFLPALAAARYVQQVRSGGAASDPYPPSGPKLIRPLRDFLAAESASGLLLIVFAGLAMLWANSPWKAAYRSLWSTQIAVQLGRWSLHLDARDFVNDALMTVFFFVVGLEDRKSVV